MPLSRWFPRSPKRDPSPPNPVIAQPFTDNSTRIHFAANDPEFPLKREAAIARICAAISSIADPCGYTRKGTTWGRTSDLGRSAVHLQRSRYGFTASINLRFLLADGTAPLSADWAQGGDIALQDFRLPHEGPHLEDGDIFYPDVYERPASLDLPMQILATRALPWLNAHHLGAPYPTIAECLRQSL